MARVELWRFVGQAACNRCLCVVWNHPRLNALFFEFGCSEIRAQ